MKNPVKKILCTVMALLVVGTSGVVFTGCGSDNSKDSSSSKEKTTTEAIKATNSEGEEYEEIEWPSDGIASRLPEPKSKIGEIASDSSDYLQITLAGVAKSDFTQYMKDCKTNGFTVDYDHYDDNYSAKDASGYELSLDYDKVNQTMEIWLDAPDEEETTVATKPKTTKPKATKPKATKPKTTKKTTSKKSNSSSGVNADFKATMDSYEEFFNDYVDFMKKYNNSTDIVSMATDYAKYTKEYAEKMQSFKDEKTDDLSVADAAYYLEVEARITKKLAEVAN